MPHTTPEPIRAPAGVRVSSEIGALRRVVCHTPGTELLAVTPNNREDFLYDDILDHELSRREHNRFKAVLSRFAQVDEVRDLLVDIVDVPDVRRMIADTVFEVARDDELARRLEAIDGSRLISMLIEGEEAEGGALARVVNTTSWALPPLPNLFFTRDASMVVNTNVVIGSMKYAVRWTEELLMKAVFLHHPTLKNDGIIYDGSAERRPAFTIEGGDVHVLRHDLILIGASQRSSPTAVDGIAEQLVRDHGVKDVLVVLLPDDRAMIHLDMVFTQVDRNHCLIFPPAFIGPTRYPVLHYHAQRQGMSEPNDLFSALRELGMPLEPVFCGGHKRSNQEREQWSSGCNYVALRPGVIVGYERTELTCRELQAEAGFRIVKALDFLTGDEVIEGDDKAVITFEGSELVRGGGGGRCMTLPILRDEVA